MTSKENSLDLDNSRITRLTRDWDLSVTSQLNVRVQIMTKADEILPQLKMFALQQHIYVFFHSCTKLLIANCGFNECLKQYTVFYFMSAISLDIINALLKI